MKDKRNFPFFNFKIKNLNKSRSFYTKCGSKIKFFLLYLKSKKTVLNYKK